MTSPAYRLTQLAPGFDLGAFDCGVGEYNDWLLQHAAWAVAAGSAAVYVMVQSSTAESVMAGERVVGYFAICPTMVVRDSIPKSMRGGVLRGAPAWLIAKLALDASMRGDRDRRWGSQLLREALETIVASADRSGGQIIVVDADNEGLVGWYRRHGFLPTGGSGLRLFMKVSTARRHLGQPYG